MQVIKHYINNLDTNSDTKITFKFTDGLDQILIIKARERLGNDVTLIQQRISDGIDKFPVE